MVRPGRTYFGTQKPTTVKETDVLLLHISVSPCVFLQILFVRFHVCQQVLFFLNKTPSLGFFQILDSLMVHILTCF